MTTILAIDPGPVESALLEWDGERVHEMVIMHNPFLRARVEERVSEFVRNRLPVQVAIEMIASYGMSVGKEVFETCLQIGRLQELVERNGGAHRLVYRLQVKQHLCHDSRAKDSNIRQALLDRFGPVGTIKAKGRLYGVKSHLWSALAIAVYAADNPLDAAHG